MGTRRQARECALQILYRLDFDDPGVEEAIRRYWQAHEAVAEVRSFASDLVRGVRASLDELDSLLASHSMNWKLSRMAAVDKNILRLAAFELMHRPDIPAKVSINEAVEIAKRFGTADSGAFVNGILDNIAKGSDKACTRGEG